MVLSDSWYFLLNAGKYPKLTQILLLSKEVASVSYAVSILNRMVEIEEDYDLFE